MTPSPVSPRVAYQRRIVAFQFAIPDSVVDSFRTLGDPIGYVTARRAA